MKKNFTIYTLFVGVFIFGSAFIVKDVNGKASYSNAPGDFGTCTSCHAGGAGPTTLSFSTTPALDPGNVYTPGTTYTISIQVTNSNFTKFGFDAVMLSGSTSTSGNSGTMTTAGAGVKFLTGTQSRKNATHTTPKTGTGNAIFTFVWVAPMSSTATVIYASGNAVNGDNGTNGDAVGTGVFNMVPSSATGVQENKLSVNELRIFPNPASGMINIDYYLNESKPISIELYSINGQKVFTLINEIQGAGYQERSLIIPANITSGVYFLKVSSNDTQLSQRLITIN